MKYPKITLTLTYVNRRDLLKKTLESFLDCCLDLDLISRWIIGCDGTPKKDIDWIKKNYPAFEIVESEGYGQANNLRTIFPMVKTDYFFHLESDWLFVKKDNFIRKSFDIINSDYRIHEVTLRYWQGMIVKQPGLEYRMNIYHPDIEHPEANTTYYGYTLNPGLRVTETVKKLLPYIDTDIHNRSWDRAPAREYYEQRLRVANLPDKYIEHTGEGENSVNMNINSHLLKWKNKNKGKRCFVVGSAPSLHKHVLSFLDGQIIFGSNQLYKFYRNGLPEIDYYFIGDHTCIPKRETDRQAGHEVDRYGQAFYRKGGYWVHVDQFDGEPYYLNDGDMTKQFSVDINRLQHGYTIIHEALTFAIYMGFVEIYLIGIDMFYSNPAECKFPIDKAIDCFKPMKKECDRLGIKIYNAGIGGQLEVFPRVDYYKLFQEPKLKVDICIPTMKSEVELHKKIQQIKGTVYHDCNIIVTGQPVSAARNRNIALDRSTAQYIIMMDDDIEWFYKGWDYDLLKPLLYKDVCMVSARCMTPEFEPALTKKYYHGIDTGEYVVIPKLKQGILPSSIIAFERTELRFDENIKGALFDDADFCFQMNKKYRSKKKFIMNNKCRMIHLNERKGYGGKKEYGTLNKEEAKNAEINRRYFIKKWKVK